MRRYGYYRSYRGYRGKSRSRSPLYYATKGLDIVNDMQNWRLRGKYYDDYYKNTGKRPRYYNPLSRKKIKW